MINKLASQSATLFAIRACGAGLSFFYNILLARLLGAEGTGVYFLAATIVGVSAIVSRLGLDNSILQTASSAFSENNTQKLAALYRQCLFLILVSSLIIILILFFTSEIITNSFFSSTSLKLPLQVMSFNILPLALLNIHAELLKALRKPQSATLIQGFAVPLMGVILVYALVPTYGVLGAVAASVISCLTVLFASILLCYKYWPTTKLNYIHNSSLSMTDLLLSSLPFMAIAILNVIIDFSDTIMLGALASTQAVGIYAAILSISRISSLILSSVNSLLAPEFSSLWAAKQHKELQGLAQTATKKMFFVALLLLIITVALAKQILFLFGSDFVIGNTALIIMAIGQFFVLGTGPVAYLLMMTGHAVFHRNNVLFSAVLNIALNFILIPLYDINGAAIATSLALTIKNIIAVYYVRKKLNINVLGLLLKLDEK